MEQNITVTRLDGTTYSLQSKATRSAITSMKQTVELLNTDIVDITVDSGRKIVFCIGDKITVLGRDYTLNIPAKEQKLSENRFIYTLQFEGVQYDLGRVTYDINIDTTGSDLKGNSLTGDMKMFLDVLLLNANRVFPAKWVLGTYPVETETITETFGETDNCLAVLQNICQKFNQEFEIEIASNGVRTLNIKTVGKTFEYTFEYGKGKGVYDLTREKVNSSNIVNRLKIYGGTKNITVKYRADRLCLAGATKSQSYLEDSASIAKFGVWEGVKIFEEIYPNRIGVVSALGDTILKFVDNTMDFDLNEKEADGVTTKYLLAGVSAKIHFNTGNLAGYEFDLSSYDHNTKTFVIISQTDERDMTFPSSSSEAFQIGVGDQYVILDIALPQSYIDTAELKLQESGSLYLSQNCVPKIQYSLSIDPDFLKKIVGADVLSNIFWAGDSIPIQDADMNVDALIRLKGFTRDLMEDYSYSLTISDMTVSRTVYNRIISDIIDHGKIITINNLRDPARARRNWLAAQELYNMIFDPEGYYYSGKIKPLSIETTMLSVGAKSMQFGLVGTVFQPNYGGNKNRILYKGGTLVHYTINPTEPRSWQITDGDVTFPLDATAYYIYAKVERVGTGGSILFSTEQLSVESDANYYHFWIGVISSVDSALQTRLISLTYGFTTINGRHIKTGRISSSGDGDSYFDLDSAEMVLGDALLWNVNGDGKLVIKGAIIQNDGGIEGGMVIFRGAYDPEAIYYKNDSVTYNGSAWVYKNATPSAGNAPAENTFWTVYSAKGQGGTVTLVPTKQVFNYTAAGVLAETGAWFVFANVFNIPGTLYYEWLVNDVSVQNAINYGYNLVPPANISSMPVKYKVNVRVGSITSDIVATDMITVYGVKPGADGNDGADGADGLTVVVTNEAHVLPAASDGTVSSYIASGTDIVVFSGVNQVPYGTGLGTFDVTAVATGITAGAASTVSTYIRRFADHSAMTADNATITFTIKVRNASGAEVIITKTQSLSKAKTGATGPNGAAGPSLLYRGQWNSSTADYTGSATRVDVVRTGSAGSYVFYKAKTTAGTIPANTDPTNNSTYWENFGASFQSVATSLLLAESANIAEFIFKGGKLISQRGTISGVESTDYMNASFVPYVSIDGTTGDVTFRKATIEGALNAGSIGGFTIANGRIGSLENANGLSILNSLIKFYQIIQTTNVPSTSYAWAGIGENVLPVTSGVRAVGRFENKEHQGYYQQVFDHVDTYYSEADYFNAGSPEPAEWFYDEYDNFLRIEVTIYRDEWVIVPDSLNYGVISTVEGADQNIAFAAIKGKITALYGGVVAWDIGYYGAAYTDILELHIEKYSQFFFSSISSALLTVRLPETSFITAHTSGNVLFLLNITISYAISSNGIRLTSVTNGQLRDNAGNALAYIDMYKGDSVLLRYNLGSYYIVSLRQ